MTLYSLDGFDFHGTSQLNRNLRNTQTWCPFHRPHFNKLVTKSDTRLQHFWIS